MSIEELIQRVQSMYSKGVQASDTRLRSRHIYSKLMSVRSRLIYQKLNKNQKISSWNYQYIECAELIVAPISECPCLPDNSCKTLRTRYKLPLPLNSLDSHKIQSVTNIEGGMQYDETTWENLKYFKGNKYTATKKSWYVKNGYLYITDTINARVVTISGLFHNPQEVYNYPSICKEPSQNLDCSCLLEKDFPIDPELADVLIEIATVELIDKFNQNKEDQTNDAKDNVTQESK
jgi:hypothetical protein